MGVITHPQQVITSGSHSTGSPGTECGNCEAPLDGFTLCHSCTTPLEADLRAVAGIWEGIMVSGSRLDVGAPSVGGSGGHAASQEPANLDALDRAQTLRVILDGWKSQLPTVGPFGEQPVIARWNEFEGGPCGGIMMSLVAGRIAKCRLCGASDSSKERQQWLISEAWHVQAFLPDVARWLTTSGHARIDIKKARNWVNAGKLEPDVCDLGTQRELYTPASVIAVYRDTPTGRRERLTLAS